MTTVQGRFGARLAEAMHQRGPLCVGLDPHPGLLESWGLPDTADGVARFARLTLEACTDVAAAVKPNAAFFERHGGAGVTVLEEVLRSAAERGLLTILDAKRGDIGSTMQAYADAYLSPGAPLEADAITVSPYLGWGSLAPAFDLAAASGKGVFVLALTSNPDGAQVQHARTDDGTAVAAVMAARAAEVNRGADPMGDVGLVVGATVGTAVAQMGIDLGVLNGPILAPGVGAQGAGPAELSEVFGNARRWVLVNQSRGVLHAGPDVEALRESVVMQARIVRDALSQ